MKRSDVLTWDEYFMGIAHLSARRSKDPSTQVGACIVSAQHRVVGIGYNGFPNGCSDDEFPWEREGAFAETKYPFVVHAELNAILNSTQNLSGCTIYVSLFPCNECAKANANVLEVTQTIIQDMFAMFMMIDISKLNQPLSDFSVHMEETGKKKNLVIHVMHEDIFQSMHRI